MKRSISGRANTRRAGSISALLALTSASLVLLAPPASAQPYPPGPCRPTVGSQELGSFNVGATFRFFLAPICPFVPGGAVSVSVNGVPVGTKFADGNGFVPVQIEVLSNTILSVDDPVQVPAVCGRNTATGTGFSAAANSNVTQTAFFTVICAAVQPQVGRVAFTGANIIRWSLVALAAMLVGVMLVASTRRRRQGRHPADDPESQLADF